jgi:transcriptional regulator with XRE-family HTH domain
MGEYLDISSNIRRLRDKSGLNQRQFAEKVGVFSADYLRKIERGDIKEPKYHHLLAIAQVCDCSVDYILTGIEIAENQNMNMQTESAKEAIKHLNKCARSIEKLDFQAFSPSNENPKINQVVKTKIINGHHIIKRTSN